MNIPRKIIIADDHPLFRQALLQTLMVKLPTVSWIEAESIEQLNIALDNNRDADLLLLDLNIPGAHGFNTLIKIRSQYSQLPVVVVSAHEDDDTVIKSMEFGASGFIPKSTPVDMIFKAIQQVLKGDTWLPEHINLNRVSDKSDIGERVRSLTPQQHKILLMFAEGLLNKQIAHQLNLSEATVKAHATAIFRKLKVFNRTQAVIAINQLEVGSSPFSNSE
ncbi:MAG: LuxR family DNA-binding response regulator [Osedax symbiont Rs1]|nr:MAG: LuxR family DNA-binding response regulator [Osedax symbiont Rs1]